MRPKFIVAVFVTSSLLLAAVLSLKNATDKAATEPPPSEVARRDSTLTPTPTVAERVGSAQLGTIEQPVATDAAVAAEVSRLTELSMKNDPESLPEILTALTYPDREVREAAIEAIKQVGDSNAIPALKRASESVDDVEEKIEFLEAIDFLSVPPIAFNEPVVPKTPEQIQVAERRRAVRRAESAREEAESRSRKSIVKDSLTPPSAAQ